MAARARKRTYLDLPTYLQILQQERKSKWAFVEEVYSLNFVIHFHGRYNGT
jgi:hypothetical protein